MNSPDSDNAIDLNREFQEIKAENKRLKTFSEIGKTLFTERNIEKLLPLVMSEISACIGADRSTLFLVDWERLELWTKFGEGLEVDRINIRMRMGLIGVCVLTRQLVNVANAYEDPRFNANIDEATGYRTESVLCAPLSNEAGEILGALQLLNSKMGIFTEEDEQEASTTAATLSEIDYETDESLDKARGLVRELRQSTECERGSLFLIDREKGDLISIFAEGIDDQEIRLSLNLGIAGLVAITGRELIIPDAYADPRFDNASDKKTGYRTRCLMCVPIKNQSGEILGVIEGINKKEGTFTDADLEFLGALSSFVAISIENAMLFLEQNRQFKSILEVLVASIDAKDSLTAGHSKRVTEFAVGIAGELGFEESEVDVLSMAALLHDYGKLGTDENILKKPSKLSSEEFEHIKQHVQDTRDILDKMYFMRKYRSVPLIASCHHENLDGTGYSGGLKGTEIPFMSRIITIADVFEALISDRHYRKGYSEEEAFEILEEDAGIKYDENVVAALKQYWSQQYPKESNAGSGDSLNDGQKKKSR